MGKRLPLEQTRLNRRIKMEPQTTPTVTLYVVPDCPLCARARGWLERHNITYTARDVANDFGALRRMYKLTHQRFGHLRNDPAVKRKARRESDSDRAFRFTN